MNTKQFVNGFKAGEKNEKKGEMTAAQFIEWLDQNGEHDDCISGAKHWYRVYDGTPPEYMA